MVIVKYWIVNKKDAVIDVYDSAAEAEAKAKSEKGIKWGWKIKKVEYPINEHPEIWELEGSRQNPDEVLEHEEW